jgi:uncharacterized membrane protein YphA (DoxX/SURF4 family)
MNIFLWIVQGMLAAVFLMVGYMKVSDSKEGMKEKGGGRMDWVDDLSDTNLKLIGVLELLAAIGLILLQLTDILPWLTPLAAVGIIAVMIGAMVLHRRRGDGTPPLVINLVLLLLALVVAVGRFQHRARQRPAPVFASRAASAPRLVIVWD